MCKIPTEIDNNEYIMRTIFSPANFNNKGKLRPNYMRPQISKPDEDDETIASNKLSVTRYNYTNIEFCRKHAKSHSSLPNRTYWGFARFIVKDIRDSGADVVFKPAEDNPAHANIVYPFCCKIGEPLDSKIELMIKQLVGKAKILQDPKPDSEKWEGENPLE